MKKFQFIEFYVISVHTSELELLQARQRDQKGRARSESSRGRSWVLSFSLSCIMAAIIIKKAILLIALALFVAVQGCTTPAQLKTNIEQLFKSNSAMTRTSPGVYVQQYNSTARDWVDIYALRHQDYHTPASNNKVLTTAAIITSLGTHHVIKTPVYASGVGSTGISTLCIAGKGDPSMTHSKLDSFVSTLKQFGVGNVGQIILDDSYFQPAFPDGWEWGDLPYYYGAAPSSFILDENVMTVMVHPGATVGAPLTITFTSSADAQHSNRIITALSTTTASGSATFDVSWRIGNNNYYITGGMPLGAAPMALSMAVIDTTDRFSYQLSYYLAQQSIQAPKPVVGSCAPFSNQNPYYTFASQTLGDMVNRTLQISDNLMAEVWSRTLGALAPGSGSAPYKGLAAVSDVLNGLGVHADSFRQVDGSGLDCANLVSPWSLLNTFKAMGRGGYAAEYKSYLPNSRPGGGLYSRFVNTPAVNRVFAKTGYISLVSSLSGWVDDNKLFSIMLDHSKASGGARNAIINQIVLWVADLCPLN